MKLGTKGSEWCLGEIGGLVSMTGGGVFGHGSAARIFGFWCQGGMGLWWGEGLDTRE